MDHCDESRGKSEMRTAREMIDDRLSSIEAATPLLDGLRKQYEAQFASVAVLESLPTVPFTHTPPEPETSGESATFEHREVFDIGETAVEALKKWKSRLDLRPCSGKRLLWRVPPELDCWLDFVQMKEVWKVYARFVVLP
jgi:hypothetical protein